MTLTELRGHVREALRGDVAEARRLVRRYAARAKTPLEACDAKLLRAEADYVAGRLKAAARGFAATTAHATRIKARRHEIASELGAVQVLALLGEAGGVAASARRLRRWTQGDRKRRAFVESALGTAYAALGDERRAEAALRTALRLWGSAHTDASAAARQNLAIRLARRGAVREALRHFDAALAHFDGTRVAAEIRHNRGWARAVAGRPADALEDLHAARDAFDGRGDRRRAAIVRADEAELRLSFGDRTTAAELAHGAAQALRRAGAKGDEARALRIAVRAGRTRLARRAETLAREAGDRCGVAEAAVLRGRDLARNEALLLRRGHGIAAAEALLARVHALRPARALALIERRAPAYPPPLRRWFEPVAARLRAATATGAVRVRALRAAFRAVERLRTLAPFASLRATLLAVHAPVYEELAEALLERGRAADRREAFLVLDAARARTLREETGLPAAESRATAEARARLEALWRTLSRLEGEGGDLRGADVRLLGEVAAGERTLLRALRDAERPAPALRAPERLPRRPCLAFAVVRDDLVALLAGDGAVRTWSCGPVARTRADLAALRFQVARRLHGASDTDAADAILARLGARLLPGLASAPATLHVVLPALIGDLPLEALPPLRDVVVVHAPCAAGRARRWRPSPGALVVGIGGDRLPAVAQETAAVQKSVRGAQILQGRDATRAAILKALPRRTLVHIAGHAIARDDVPPLSALQVHEGWLAAADLRGPALSRALVVLSACRSGDPSLQWRAETMGGFPRALLAAGAAGVVATRWAVSDRTAQAWMRRFYAALATMHPETAAATAARHVRKSRPHPADWAAFLFIRGGVL